MEKDEILSLAFRVPSQKPTGRLYWKLEVNWVDYEKNWVRFSWLPLLENEVMLPSLTFVEVVKALGELPLPPYLNRKASLQDRTSYQTVYSHIEGAVAAPTAGLHFTENVFAALAHKSIKHDFVTLHVGAGTFQPVKVANAVEHTMHSEQVVFRKPLIENLIENIDYIIVVGTTSMRSLESLYWFGVKLINNDLSPTFFIEKLAPYQKYTHLPSAKEALRAVIAYMKANDLEELVGETEILIFPSYEFKLCKGLITNFHQPGSTLMLLVAAFIGPHWRTVYAEALANDYRFLSYGDSSLLLP
ncbi:MAG: S-adenosylmethionine:tRNA ribosyltransferase-isomerase [Spirosomataceae bacterium]